MHRTDTLIITPPTSSRSLTISSSSLSHITPPQHYPAHPQEQHHSYSHDRPAHPTVPWTDYVYLQNHLRETQLRLF